MSQLVDLIGAIAAGTLGKKKAEAVTSAFTFNPRGASAPRANLASMDRH